jgi:hypothetical protein
MVLTSLKMNNQIYQTTDLKEVVHLTYAGFQYKDIFLLDDKKTVVFVFDLTNELSKELAKFRKDEYGVVRIIENFKNIKSKIYSLKNQQWQLKSYYPKNQIYYWKKDNYHR